MAFEPVERRSNVSAQFRARSPPNFVRSTTILRVSGAAERRPVLSGGKSTEPRAARWRHPRVRRLAHHVCLGWTASHSLAIQGGEEADEGLERFTTTCGLRSSWFPPDDVFRDETRHGVDVAAGDPAYVPFVDGGVRVLSHAVFPSALCPVQRPAVRQPRSRRRIRCSRELNGGRLRSLPMGPPILGALVTDVDVGIE